MKTKILLPSNPSCASTIRTPNRVNNDTWGGLLGVLAVDLATFPELPENVHPLSQICLCCQASVAAGLSQIVFFCQKTVAFG